MNQKNFPPLVWIAFTAVCIVWGTTYFGVQVGVKYFPPFFFSALRHGVAAVIILLLYLTQSRKIPTWSDIKHASIAGILMITGGNALMSWALKYIPSGLAGILSAVTPILITLISIYTFPNFKITWRIMLGLVVAFMGIVLMSKPQQGLQLTPEFWLGFFLLFTSNTFWGIGSVYMKKKPIDQHPFLRTSIQMLPASFLNLLIGFIFEPMPDIRHIDIHGWAALAYVILSGSLIGYLSLVYLIKYMTPARLSIHIYVNTVVAVLIGWLFGGEHLTLFTWGALIVIMLGVFIVNNEYAKMSAQT